MKKCILFFSCLLLIPLQALAFQPQNACNYLQDINGLATGGYKSDGMGEYFCCSPYKMLDKKSNLAYYVEGPSNTKANKVYLVLNVYSQSNKASVHSSLLAASKILTKKATNEALDPKIASCILAGKSASFKQGKYTIEVKKQVWSTGLGYDTTFSIKE